MPEELWTEVLNIIQEMVIKTIPKKKKCKMIKWLFEEALQIAEKRRQGKGKGERERYTHLNAEFQRIAGRDKKVLLSRQYRKRKTSSGHETGHSKSVHWDSSEGWGGEGGRRAG